jgi:uncharacterized membrane protein
VRYNDAVPNAAERILAMAEDQSRHRRKLEASSLRHNQIRAYLGLACAFAITIGALGTSVYCILQGHDTAGAVLFGGSLVSIVTVFVQGVKFQKSEREGRYKAVNQD